jgi:hypothetical protein
MACACRIKLKQYIYLFLANPTNKMAAATIASMPLVSNDGIAVEFSNLHIQQMNYITTVLEDCSCSFEVDVASKYLLLLKELFTLKDSKGTPFKQEPQTKIYRGITYKVPPYNGCDDPWASTNAAGTYYTFLTKIPVEELCELFKAVDYLHCEDILHGIAYILIQHMLNYTADVRQILKTSAPHAAGILAKICVAHI